MLILCQKLHICTHMTYIFYFKPRKPLTPKVEVLAPPVIVSVTINASSVYRNLYLNDLG